MAERMLTAVIQEVVHGIWIRSVDDLVKALGMDGTSKLRSVSYARNATSV
jgi:transposase-like protein